MKQVKVLEPVKLQFPCGEHCVCCHFNDSPSTTMRTIHATFEYELGSVRVQQPVTVQVPDNLEPYQWGAVLQCGARAIGEANEGVNFVTMGYQYDGGNAPYTRLLRLKDWWYRVSFRGKPFMRHRFVPIWRFAPGPNWPASPFSSVSASGSEPTRMGGSE